MVADQKLDVYVTWFSTVFKCWPWSPNVSRSNEYERLWLWGKCCLDIILTASHNTLLRTSLHFKLWNSSVNHSRAFQLPFKTPSVQRLAVLLMIDEWDTFKDSDMKPRINSLSRQLFVSEALPCSAGPQIKRGIGSGSWTSCWEHSVDDIASKSIILLRTL